MNHNDGCERAGKWFKLAECREFSTDGTAMGAVIAHMFGTTNDDEIMELQRQEERREREAMLTGMDEEQADWEADE
jgi:hypothetical protein